MLEEEEKEEELSLLIWEKIVREKRQIVLTTRLFILRVLFYCGQIFLERTQFIFSQCFEHCYWWSPVLQLFHRHKTADSRKKGSSMGSQWQFLYIWRYRICTTRWSVLFIHFTLNSALYAKIWIRKIYLYTLWFCGIIFFRSLWISFFTLSVR